MSATCPICRGAIPDGASREAHSALCAAVIAEAAAAALGEAWGIIANAHGGDWSKASPEWRDAAERWRDRHATRRIATPTREDIPAEVVDALLALEQTLRDMRGAVAPYTRRVDDQLRRLDELRGSPRETPRIVLAERAAVVVYLRAHGWLAPATDVESGKHVTGNITERSG